MASDQIIELLKSMKETPAWLSEFYSAVANSELIMPMILHTGKKEPIPITMRQYTEATAVFDSKRNDYLARRPGDGGNSYCLLYSSHDVYNGVKLSLEPKLKEFGQIVEPLVRNGRQLINMCCKRKQRAAINLYAEDAPRCLFTFEQMELIQRKPLIVNPILTSGTE